MQIDEAREPVDEALYVRFQSPVRNERGHFSGVFGLVNGLARSGKLSAEQERFRRANNDWYNAAYPDPSTVDPTVYDHALHPGAAAWFKSTSRELITRVDGYLEILTAHGIECRMIRSSNPGGSSTRTSTRSSSYRTRSRATEQAAPAAKHRSRMHGCRPMEQLSGPTG
ncbi:hypothetical protein SVIO_055640 [Streptomyces violaceusniger]|uniref:Uncharacterized protein n=1 Tax=Streptomyces violaceusniger TaxID=68280 RepID=A0A4D4L038_STRVO|nr:hypothetical protein SVIO_055640 [Streptomyces violaceusniger]